MRRTEGIYPAAQGGCGHIHAGEWEGKLTAPGIAAD